MVTPVPILPSLLQLRSTRSPLAAGYASPRNEKRKWRIRSGDRAIGVNIQRKTFRLSGDVTVAKIGTSFFGTFDSEGARMWLD